MFLAVSFEHDLSSRQASKTRRYSSHSGLPFFVGDWSFEVIVFTTDPTTLCAIEDPTPKPNPCTTEPIKLGFCSGACTGTISFRLVVCFCSDLYQALDRVPQRRREQEEESKSERRQRRKYAECLAQWTSDGAGDCTEKQRRSSDGDGVGRRPEFESVRGATRPEEQDWERGGERSKEECG